MGLVQRYIKVPDDIATENYGNINGVDTFNYGLTIYGDFFVDVNTVNTHPEVIAAMDEIEYIDIDYDDIIMYDENGEITTKNYKKPSRFRIPVVTKKREIYVSDNENRRFNVMNKPNLIQRIIRRIKQFFKNITQ